MDENNTNLQSYLAQDTLHNLKTKLRQRAGTLDKLA